jgi:hypothetical protein
MAPDPNPDHHEHKKKVNLTYVGDFLSFLSANSMVS